MADEPDKKQSTKTAEAEKQSIHPAGPVVSDANNGARTRASFLNRRGLLIGLLGFLVIVFFVLVATSIARFNTRLQRAENGNTLSFTGGMHAYGDDRFSRGRGMQTELNDGTVTTTVYSYLTGVVAAVNSDNIVVVGNGKQTTIKTNSSTIYVNDDKPAVNDTVIIAGTTADDVITATQIRVANR